MRALILSITAGALFALATPANAQTPVPRPLYDPFNGGYVTTPGYYGYIPMAQGPRVWGPTGYYSYQPYVYNASRQYGFNTYSTAPQYTTYTYTYYYRYGH
jgi:hypothetical protein